MELTTVIKPQISSAIRDNDLIFERKILERNDNLEADCDLLLYLCSILVDGSWSYQQQSMRHYLAAMHKQVNSRKSRVPEIQLPFSSIYQLLYL